MVIKLNGFLGSAALVECGTLRGVKPNGSHDR
jgi:hypothetical protein